MRRLAVWSGPRNLSTALMRSFSSRSDCAVSDEPFYAAYLAATGFEHPGRQDVLASQPQDWRRVATAISEGPAPLPRPVWYQKHMAQHMRAEMVGPWLERLDHALLVRHPARVIASYLKVFPAMTLAETGLPWQMRLFAQLESSRGAGPVVIDAADLRRSPEATLRRLCVGLGLAWDPAMLAWPAGPHPQDGVWAPHWYESTWCSTGFEPVAVDEPLLPEPDVPFLAEAVALYDRLRSCSNAETQPTTS
mgnify:FL=1|jgi:hypothetical protein